MPIATSKGNYKWPMMLQGPLAKSLSLLMSESIQRLSHINPDDRKTAKKS
jgi:hypothetical protein